MMVLVLGWGCRWAFLVCEFSQGVREKAFASYLDLSKGEVAPFSIGGQEGNLDISYNLPFGIELLVAKYIFGLESAKVNPLLVLHSELAFDLELFRNARVHLVALDDDRVNCNLLIQADDYFYGQKFIGIHVFVRTVFQNAVYGLYLWRTFHYYFGSSVQVCEVVLVVNFLCFRLRVVD